MKYLYLLFSFLFFSNVVYSQYQIGLVPRTSPDKGIYQKVGYTTIEIRYGSPSVNGRQIWGNLAPYGEVWRAGANNATTIHFSDSVIIDNQVLPGGTYALFIIPNEHSEWTFIFSKDAQQWGAFRYDAADDALRVSAMPQTIPSTEQLYYSIDQFGFSEGRVNMHWGETRLSFDFQTNYLQQFIQTVEEKAANDEVAGSWVSWLQGAEYLSQISAEPEQAKRWLLQAETAAAKDDPNWNKQYYPLSYIRGHILWVKANLAAREGNYKDAIQYTQLLKDIVSNYSFYERKKESESIDQKLQAWTVKLQEE